MGSLTAARGKSGSRRGRGNPVRRRREAPQDTTVGGEGQGSHPETALLQDASRVRRLRRTLLAWYRRHRRDLPWRSSPDAYRVLVSEFMLQQTQVATVVPYFDRFLARFPDLRSLAAAPLDDVLAAWSGLGYYRRARSLHAAARKIVAEHGGRVPREARAVRELPGVGRYTAGAIRSIAFGEPDPVVDGNVARVVSRLLRRDLRAAGAAGSRRLWAAATRLLDPVSPGDFNQALMELGATVCTPSAPGCGRCPWRRDCGAFAAGVQAELPRPIRRGAVREVRAAAALVRRGRRVLVVRRTGERQLEGLWELPGDGETAGPGGLAEAVCRRHGLKVHLEEPLGEVRHGILDRRIRLTVYAARLAAGSPSGRAGLRRWVDPEAALAGGLALAASARRALRRFAVPPR